MISLDTMTNAGKNAFAQKAMCMYSVDNVRLLQFNPSVALVDILWRA